MVMVFEQRRCKLGHRFGLHVATLRLSFVVGFQQHGADQTNDGTLVGKDADHIGGLIGPLGASPTRTDGPRNGGSIPCAHSVQSRFPSRIIGARALDSIETL